MSDQKKMVEDLVAQESLKVKNQELAKTRAAELDIAAAHRAELEEADQLLVDTTDMGNAARFLKAHGADVRYVGPWKRWLIWEGGRWVHDETHRVEELVKGCALRFAAECLKKLEEAREAFEADPEEPAVKEALEHAQRRFSFAVASQGARNLASVPTIAKASSAVNIHHSQLDQDPWLFNVRNGTVDLRTGELLPHSPRDLITKMADVRYDPNATAPRWDAFVLGAMGGKQSLVTYLRNLMGYAATGIIREHALAFFYGSGANGKSTFLRIIRRVMGDYGIAAPRSLLFKASNEQHPTELASLHQVRFAVCAEVEEGQSFDEGKIKDLTGADPISCRRMRENFWDFIPTHKLALAGNHLPVVKGNDVGIWRRIKLVPWLVTVPENERDTELPEKLERELPGILNWVIQGCLAWNQAGLGEPEEVRMATADYRRDSDLLGAFLASYCVFGQGEKVARMDLRAAYQTWCEELGVTPVGARKLAERLRSAHGVADGKTCVMTARGPRDAWQGVRLKTPQERLKADEEAKAAQTTDWSN